MLYGWTRPDHPYERYLTPPCHQVRGVYNMGGPGRLARLEVLPPLSHPGTPTSPAPGAPLPRLEKKRKEKPTAGVPTYTSHLLHLSLAHTPPPGLSLTQTLPPGLSLTHQAASTEAEAAAARDEATRLREAAAADAEQVRPVLSCTSKYAPQRPYLIRSTLAFDPPTRSSALRRTRRRGRRGR